MASATATQLQTHTHLLRIVPRSDEIRRRALARLYERRAAVDNLIGALERYQRDQRASTAMYAATTAEGMSS
jgi:hypothetical protein